MAWIESHSTLARHPKTLRLARRLGVSVPTAIGHLHLLWWWALEYAQDGDVSAFDDEEFAEACCWEGEPAALRRALTAVGFLDDCGAIHDWDAYTARLMERRERTNAQARLRMQAFRERQRNSQVVTQDVTRNGSERYAPTVPNPTVPNRTQPPPTTPVERVAPDADAPDAPLTVAPEAISVSERKRDPLWDTFTSVWPQGPRTDIERGRWNTAAQQLRKGGVSPGELLTAAGNWPNVMGKATMTPMALASNLSLLLDGPQVNGRSDGTVLEHRQRVTETAHAPVGARAQIEAKRAQRAVARGDDR